MTIDRTILITGVTGNQGGAVAQALQGTGFHLRGLTRVPDGERAAALARYGVKGDLDDEATLRRALAGVGASSACRTACRRGSSGKKRRASVLQRWRVRPASSTTCTHPWDRLTNGRASRTSTTSGASRKPCAASVSPHDWARRHARPNGR